jgi:hypothetical protein
VPKNFRRPLPFLRKTLGVSLFALVAGLLAIPAHAAQDVVQFGSTIEVAPNETIHDAVCFFCSVNVKGKVNGDIVAFFGSVRVDGQANHDVVNFFGDVKAADNTSIGHNLVNFFGGVRLGENVSVGQDTVVMFGSIQAEPSASFGGSRVVEPAWLFWGPFLVLFCGIYFLVHEVRSYRRRRLFGVY